MDPRDLNSRADLISRLIDFDDYELNHVIFQGLDELWGLHTVDRFACNYNAKLPRTLGFSNQVPRRLTRFARTGDLITIGCVPQFVSSLGSFSIWSYVRPEGP